MSHTIRAVEARDLDALLKLEELCFEQDRLSRRSFQRWIRGESCILSVLELEDRVQGYGLVLLHKGTRLARLYSIALHPEIRGRGLANALMLALEAAAVEEDRLFMRLEVAKQNLSAVHLYQRLGYRVFGEFWDYYEDHSDALRMQKRIRYPGRTRKEVFVPWFGQTTSFTCGPACLMMVMGAVDRDMRPEQSVELDIWREATTVFMTSGHGGCHPLGLALAAHRRGFQVEVLMSQIEPIFLDGVRSAHKKEILTLVHEQFWERCEKAEIPILGEAVSVARIEQRLSEGDFVIVLISSYRLNGDKAPHWVVITASDELCFYLHDPDTEKLTISDLDCQYIPVAKDDFAKMASYGRNRFSAALFVRGKVGDLGAGSGRILLSQ